MAEVKWIKISTNIFDDEAIELIEQMPEGDAILVIWFKLLTKAGKLNDNGLFYFKENIPYTDEMLATVFKKPINIVRMAIKVFETFGMIEITDANEILIRNWEKHQNIEKLDKIRKDTRERVARYRERQKLLQDNKSCNECNAGCNVTVQNCNATEEERRKKNKKEEEDIRNKIEDNDIISEDKSSDDISKGKSITINEIKEFVNLYNSTVVRLSKVEVISETRKNKIKARLKNISLSEWKKVFEKMEASDFCCGINNKNWKASFDWILTNDNNYVKVLEGRYDNHNKNQNNNVKQMEAEGMNIL